MGLSSSGFGKGKFLTSTSTLQESTTVQTALGWVQLTLKTMTELIVQGLNEKRQCSWRLIHRVAVSDPQRILGVSSTFVPRGNFPLHLSLSPAPSSQPLVFSGQAAPALRVPSFQFAVAESSARGPPTLLLAGSYGQPRSVPAALKAGVPCGWHQRHA